MSTSGKPTVCAICQRPAIGYHCGVASCKGCKTFFRRMCVSERSDIKCLMDNDQCFTQSPPFLKCRHCRYLKCILVGMNPLALELKEEEQKAPNYRQLTKRLNESAEPEEAGKSQKQLIRNLVSIENKMQRTIDMLTYLDSKLVMFQNSSYNPTWIEIGGLSNSLESSSKISVADKMGPMPGWPLTAEYYPHRDDDFWKNSKRRFSDFNLNKKHWMFYLLLTAVEYAKTFDFFHKLDMEDRRKLVGHVAVPCMNLQASYFTVSTKHDRIINPDGTYIPFVKYVAHLNVKKEASYRGQFGFSWSLLLGPLIRCGMTSTEYILLKSICLCNPAAPNLSEHAQDIISAERALYAQTLLDHCQRTRTNGVAYFGELIGILGLMERQQRMQKDLHLVHVAPFTATAQKGDKMQLVYDIMTF